jgi:hypothetical protein
MFVRWKRRQRTKRGRETGQWVRSAYVVGGVRTEAGPRQKHICYVGSIHEGYEGHHSHRVAFWAGADANLDRAGIAGDDLPPVVAALEAIVPRPDRTIAG